MRDFFIIVVLLSVAHLISILLGMDLHAQYPFWKVVTHTVVYVSVGLIYGRLRGSEDKKKDKETP